MLRSNIAGGQYGAVGSEYSYAIAGVGDAGSDVVVVLCFRLRFIFSLCSVDGRLEERPYFPARGGGPYHIPYGDLPPGFAMATVWLRALHAQDTASAHNDV